MNVDMLKQYAPLPSIEAFQKYVFIGPHPDDIEVGCGATVSKLVQLKKEVSFIIVTDGGCGSFHPSDDVAKIIQTRKEETLQSAKFLGVTNVFFLDFPDGGEDSVEDISKKLAKLIVKLNPDVLIYPDPLMQSETHPDHIKTGRASQIAAFYSSNPLVLKRHHIVEDMSLLQTVKTRVLAAYFTDRPNTYVEISPEHLERQRDSILLHTSQFQMPEEKEMLLMYLQIRAQTIGIDKHLPLSEGFYVLGQIHQHCFPEVRDY